MGTKQLSDYGFKSIVKRDGRVVEFEFEKIVNAIAMAGSATGEFEKEVAETIAAAAVRAVYAATDKGTTSVEEMQDAVEEILLSSQYRKTAKAYILYREQHANIRNIVNTSNVDLIGQYLDKIDWQVNENSNMGYSLQGLNNYISSEISKVYWLNKIYPKEVRDAQ